MFSTDIGKIATVCEQMLIQKRFLKRCRTEIEDSISVLRHFSGLDEQIKKLQQHLEKIDSEQQKLEYLSVALERIGETYQRCEQRVLDSAEQALVHYIAEPVGMTDISDIQRMLGEMLG